MEIVDPRELLITDRDAALAGLASVQEKLSALLDEED